MVGGSRALPLGGNLPRPVHRLWGSASRAIQRHPLLLKTVSSAVGFAFGDLLFQVGTGAALPWAQPPAGSAAERRRRPLDWNRAAAMGAAGLFIAGPAGYGFIVWMEANLWKSAPHCAAALATKVALDQVLGLALWHAALAAIHEPHRQACAAAAQWPRRALAGAQQRQQQQQAASKAS
ncbi:peroxisomal membrane MPV17 PMP22 isoform 2 [Micractinium conductrix]|uniref:Peroxisomal membrane MPV17 PMP22 isoform 2 n=1 Tax=Micractinium conductrix TaxID=554055 RepID=A0A2P6VQ02_9CHLO|nr:peroxisomal membrane MPV17 PMP22 isoform 2 [Micractinium conductrix]|eukprot:PSC76150.1 peroxisomal membrane MPV17 PMP22 isoform 2 [Micractinium conductrix]